MQFTLGELRQALGVLRREPLYSFAMALTLILGIAASGAVFTVARAALLHPLACTQPNQLMLLDGALPCVEGVGPLIGPPIEGRSLDWKNQVSTFSNLALYSIGYGGVNVTGAGQPERINVVEVSVSFFPTFGVELGPGRNFLDEEQQPGKNRVVIVSRSEWRSRFGSDPLVIGRTIQLNGITHAIVGVAGEGFRYPDSTDYWVPVLPDRERLSTSPVAQYDVVGRLMAGVTPAMAQRDIYAWRDRAKVESPGSWPATREIQVVPLLDRLIGGLRESLLVLSGAVVLMLLIASANVASLVVARVYVRRREIAVRVALGASRWSAVRPLILESLVVALPGGAAGIFGAWLLVRSSVNFAAAQLPSMAGVRLDKWGIVAGVMVTGLAVVISVLAGAVQAYGRDLPGALKEGGHQSSGGVRLARFRSSVVVCEVALSLLLLIGAGLLIRSLDRLQSVRLGFDPSDVLTIGVSTPTSYQQNGRETQLFSGLIDRVSEMPGVASVGATNSLPFAGTDTIGLLFNVERMPPGLTVQERFALELDVTPGYLDAMGIGLREGRMFTDQDTSGALPVVMVNESLAGRYWPGESAVGKRMRIPGESAPREIVGVVGDTRHFDPLTDPVQQMYIPYLQIRSKLNTLVIRTSPSLRSKAALVSAVRDEVRRLDQDVPIYDVKTMDQWLQHSLARQRLLALVVLSFACAAALLAAGGVYSVVAYGAAQRTREFGIRVALGASRVDVLALILRHGAKLGALGVGIGALAAIPLTRLMTGLLYHLSSVDVLSYGAPMLGLFAITLIASLPAAMKAMLDGPSRSLRCE